MRAAAGFVAFALVLALVPFLGLPAFYETFLYLLLHAVVLATSWNILSGYSGYFSFGHGAFYIPFPELLTLALAMLLCGAMWALLRFTDFGRAARAMTEDAPMAAAFGVNEKRLGYVISGLAAAFAAVAGLCLALTHTLAPVQIYAWMGVVFAAVMIGGLGSATGPLLAGLLIGVSEALTMAVTAPTWAPLVSFSLLIAIILFRPARF
jgi:branched-chain amino acid transport system permease protein